MNKKIIYTVISIAVIIIMILIVSNIFNNNSSNSDNHAGHESSQINYTVNDVSDYLKEQDNIMNIMMTQMENIPESGDAAVDYLYGMIPHHESAVLMSESYLKYDGVNDELKKLAENIINVQKEEIEQMKNLINNLELNNKVDKTDENKYIEEYNKLFEHDMSSHSGHSEMYATVDEAFAEGMIMHHQMAVDMSEVVLKFTENEPVIEFAQNVIDTQGQEIEFMNDILDKIK